MNEELNNFRVYDREMNEKLFIKRPRGPPSESHIFDPLSNSQEGMIVKIERDECVNWIHIFRGMIMELYGADMKEIRSLIDFVPSNAVTDKSGFFIAATVMTLMRGIL